MMLKENEDENEISKAPSSPTKPPLSSAPLPQAQLLSPLTNSIEDRKVKEFIYDSDTLGSQRVYKKTSSNQLLTLYLGSRELVSRQGTVESLKGVIFIDPKIISGHKIYGQLTLTFRYGREDEEVMGLKFCNEAVIALKQLWPKPAEEEETLVPLQEALIERLGKNSVAFSLDVTTVVPPSVQLLPAKRYTGAPIGTSYDVRVFTAEPVDERVQRRSTVRLGIRLIHKICPVANSAATLISGQPSTTGTKSLRLRLSPKALKLSHKYSHSLDSSTGEVAGKPIVEFDKKPTPSEVNKGTEGSVEKPFLFAEGKVGLKAALNKSAYTHGEHLTITIDVRNDSRKVVRKIRIFAVQHVDVCMFSNGKFKNIVADLDISKQIGPNETLHGSYSLLPVRGATKNWIAVEGALFNTSSAHDTNLVALNSKLASSAPRGVQTTEEKNVFAIYVSYYVKVKLTLSSMGGEVTLKLPFVLGNVEYPDEVPTANNSSNNEPTQNSEMAAKQQLRKQSISMDTGIKLPTLSRATIKFDDTISNSIDIITEELNNIHNNNTNNAATLGKLARSDSSGSNLNDEGQYESNGHGTTVIQAQVHHHQQPPPRGGDDKSGETSGSQFNNTNQFDNVEEKNADVD